MNSDNMYKYLNVSFNNTHNKIGLQEWATHIKAKRVGLMQNLTRSLKDLANLDRDDETIVESIDVKMHFNLEIEKEKVYWEQRARLVIWITRNSFKNFLFTNGIGDMDHISAGVNICITNSMNQMLTTKYTGDKIYLALKGMGPTKALRAYGYPALFYQKFWHIIDRDVSSFYLKILNKVEEVFRPTRGLRQGDLLRLYLFLVYSESLPSLVRLAMIRKYIVLYLEICVGCQGTSLSWTVLMGRDRDSNPNNGGCVGVGSCGSAIADFIMSYLRELDKLSKKIPVRRLEAERWMTQECSYVKISFDVTFNKQGNRSCSGTIIRDSNGRAIQMGLDLGFLTVEIERDALLVVKKI
ncbi:hypothetical protein Golob_021453 [Gossypium lobatum]|uniref:Uncharacterized protein n=1 Tax=Gossypium lobatum TaxID=34289 RepID=A0A7J8LDM3_9ROSI|nr:hypothetical protein [Gossypium lobatum]